MIHLVLTSNHRLHCVPLTCRLWQHCYCEQDIHCPKGFSCVRATSFPEYKVCKAPMKNLPGTILPQLFATLGAKK
jgi:hypothetical protein